eukprot:CAMPEP_0168314604 /NCGR_PEP_ID=MMETSP0210-20121227/9168_1 /TAXON_ID=40633 /ORGANISM="Condylostoma magnum, Strain COL2" /LENGTH=148 /DNA_ID=CAMNT_0008284449 /DNA_START=142 /DNA_END=585 /DNA_ORIENTATION=-
MSILGTTLMFLHLLNLMVELTLKYLLYKETNLTSLLTLLTPPPKFLMDGMEALSLEMLKLTLMFNLREEYMRGIMELILPITKLVHLQMDMDSTPKSELLSVRKGMVLEILVLDLNSPTGSNKTLSVLIRLMSFYLTDLNKLSILTIN